MRRHAKATSAGSTPAAASNLASLRAQGSGAPSRPRALAPLFAVLALLALLLTPPLASAARVHPSEGILGAVAQPSFGRPAGMALDAAGDVLVIDIANLTVSRFHPDGTPANFSALGTNVIDGKSGEDETPGGRGILKGEATGRADEFGVAVDRSGGVANGDIYITDVQAGTVDIFASTGKYLGSLTEFGVSPANQPLGQVFGVAVDESGAVYVADGTNGIQKYLPTTNPPSNADFQSTFSEAQTGISKAGAIAAGAGSSAGYLFVERFFQGKVAKIDSSTGALEYLLQEAAAEFPAPPGLLSVDPTTGHVYLGYGSSVREFDAGAASPTLLSTTATASEVEGVAASETGELYVSRFAHENVDVYGPLGPPTPFIEGQSVISVSATEATLEAQIDPEGSATSFQVQYGPTEAYGESTPIESLGSDETSHVVQVQIKNLIPGSEYHFRFLATNVVGPAQGSDRTFHTPALGSGAQSCPNQAFRVGAAAQLPDCRAYEMVSPVEKGGFNIEAPVALGPFRAALYQASTSGNALTYATSQGFAAPEGAPYSRQYLATRSAAGWESSSIGAPQNRTRRRAADRADLEYRIFSPDLCHGGLLNWSEPALVAPATDEAPNIYARDLCGSNNLSAVSANPHLAVPEIGGISADGRCMVSFANEQELRVVRTQHEQNPTEHGEDPGGLYETCGPSLTRIDLLPDGSPTAGMVLPGTNLGSSGLEFRLRESVMASAVSENASTVYWSDINPSLEEDPNRGRLYVRINAEAPQSALGPSDECLEPTMGCTLPISSQVEPAENVVAQFGAASSDGSRAYYYFESDPVQGNLYEFDLASRSSRLVATGLPLLGSSNQPIAPVLGASTDGSRVYFFSTKRLNGEGVNGELNLFLFEAASAADPGSTRLVATMPLASNSGLRELNPVEPPYFRSARITPDGLHAVFTSDQPLTGYDNRAQGSGNPAVEVYAYDALANGGQGGLSCVSCNPTGQRPEARHILNASASGSSEAEYAGVIPGYYTAFHGPRAISDDGSRVFFEAFDALLPKDTNGKADVYEWTQEGAHGCSTQNPAYSPLNGGCLSLLSSGESSSDSKLIDATADGSDVFFATSQSLLPQDPGLLDLYDARINGGFPPPPGLAAACEGEACQGPLVPPNDPTPSSATYRGPGNVLSPAKAKKKKAKKRHHHKKKKAHGAKQKRTNASTKGASK